MYMMFLPVCVCARHVYAFSGGQKRVSDPQFGAMCVWPLGTKPGSPATLAESFFHSGLAFGTIGRLELMEDPLCLNY